MYLPVCVFSVFRIVNKTKLAPGIDQLYITNSWAGVHGVHKLFSLASSTNLHEGHELQLDFWCLFVGITIFTFNPHTSAQQIFWWLSFSLGFLWNFTWNYTFMWELASSYVMHFHFVIVTWVTVWLFIWLYLKNTEQYSSIEKSLSSSKFISFTDY